MNFNTLLISILIAVVGFGGAKLYEKIDSNNTELIKVSTSQNFVVQRLSDVEKRLMQMVSQEDFRAEIRRLSSEIDVLKKRKMIP